MITKGTKLGGYHRSLSDELSPSELKILILLADGYSDQQIAATRDCSIYTIKKHISNIRDKLQAVNKIHAVSIGYQRGILPIKEQSEEDL